MMIGVDFGGTQIKAAAVEGATITQAAVRNTREAQSPVEVLDAIADAVSELSSAPAAVGLAIPGEVDAAGRCFRLPNVPGFEGLPIAAELTARLGCRVVVENDATTAALAELIHGHGQAHPSFVMVTLGTGIGGGLVLDGKLWRGRSGFAGEIGHLPIDRSSGWPCACGLRGCIEAYAGTQGLLRHYREGGGQASCILDIALAARGGEKAALETFVQMGRALAIGLSGVQNTLDLDAIVFSGGISASFDLIEPSLAATLKEYVFGPPLAEVPLLVSELDDKAGVVGAAHLPQHMKAVQ